VDGAITGMRDLQPKITVMDGIGYLGVKMKKKIEKVIRKAKNNENLKSASKLIELGWGNDAITWNDARYLYRLIEERRMVIKNEEANSGRD
jgi:hypothetical protein